jgi:hypothetical protein
MLLEDVQTARVGPVDPKKLGHGLVDCVRRPLTRTDFLTQAAHQLRFVRIGCIHELLSY